MYRKGACKFCLQTVLANFHGIEEKATTYTMCRNRKNFFCFLLFNASLLCCTKMVLARHYVIA